MSKRPGLLLRYHQIHELLFFVIRGVTREAYMLRYANRQLQPSSIPVLVTQQIK